MLKDLSTADERLILIPSDIPELINVRATLSKQLRATWNEREGMA